MSGIKYAGLVLLAGAASVAATDLIQGERVEAAQAVLASPSQVGRDQLLVNWEDRSADQSTRLANTLPTEALALASLWIDQAASSPAPLRRQALARAEALLARARSTRPEAPGATLLKVRLDLMRFGEPRASTLAAFAHSYRQAGFLREQALWRLAFAAVYWTSLPAATRAAAVNEALWLARLDGRLRLAVDQVVTGTPLALPVELRLAGGASG
jgi:hypothetical protein